MTLQNGRRLGPYEVISPLGAGGMGEVYRAKDARLGREVAVKVLPEQLAKDAAALARFEREAKAVAALSHPNILAIHDVGVASLAGPPVQDVHFVVMELLEGETLRARLRGDAGSVGHGGPTLQAVAPGRGPLPWRKAVEIAAGVADGLAAAHAKGVIHRDLKPENIFLTSDGVVKILDFGLARIERRASEIVSLVDEDSCQSMYPADAPTVVPDVPTLTAPTTPGTLLGTVPYMSPEQVRGERVDARSDIFSFGSVLYEMLAGRHAFARRTTAETMTAILRDEPPEIPGRSETGSAGVPTELRRIVAHCLEKRPEERFQSAKDLAFDLRAGLAAGSTGVSPVDQSRDREGAVRPRRWLVAGLLAVIAALVALISLNVVGLRDRMISLVRESFLAPSPSPQQITSLAVLPLENLSGDAEQEYFVDGMTDALISDLAKIGALRVISRTSAMRFKGTDKSIPEIARLLNVDAVVEGSVLRAGDRVRITVELIHGATDRHLWADSYERELRDILALQSEVARAIAREIRVTLTPPEERRLAAAQAVDPEVHQLYLRGRYHWNKRTEAGFKKAIEYFEQAVDKDPSCALAYAGLADSYSLLESYGVLAPKEAYAKAEAAALKALEIDGTLAEAHASLGSIKEHCRDWLGAEQEYRQAIHLNPGYASARHWYAMLLMTVGRWQEAIAEARRAQEDDPLSPAINVAVGYVLYDARRYEQAIGELREAIELDPHFGVAHNSLGEVYGVLGRHTEAIAELERAVALSENAAEDAAWLARAYAMAGKTEEARQHLADLDRRGQISYVAPALFGLIYAGLGENDRAFEWFEKAYDEHDSYLFHLTSPINDRLRDDPRFDDLLRRMGLDPSAYPKPQAAKPPAGKIMLAVLPVEDLSRDPEQEYFSDGLTEEMIARLGSLSLEKVAVIGRTSVMRFKGTTKPLDQIARELGGIDYVLEGAVRHGGGQLRITAKLIHVRDQTQIWAESYDRTPTDVLAVQAEVARAVTQAIRIKLTPQEQAQLAKARPVDPEAREFYLKGRYYWNRRTEAGFYKAIEYFQQAIDRDPRCALAYAGLADSYSLLAGYGVLPPKEAYPKAKAAATRALELDDTLAEAHASLGGVKEGYDSDWSGAEKEYKQAIRLNPGYASARHWYAMLLLMLGRPQEAVAEIKRAQELDPLSPIINTNVGYVFYEARQYEQALEECRKVLELAPDFGVAHSVLGEIYGQMDRPEEAIASLKRAVALSDNAAEYVARLGHAYALGGMEDEARQVLSELDRRSRESYVAPSLVGMIYAGLGEKDRAFEWLEKAYQERDNYLLYPPSNPTYDPLRDDPRFDDLLRRMGLDPSAYPKPRANAVPAVPPSAATQPSSAGPPRPASSKIASLAVLPLENRSEDRTECQSGISCVPIQSNLDTSDSLTDTPIT